MPVLSRRLFLGGERPGRHAAGPVGIGPLKEHAFGARGLGRRAGWLTSASPARSETHMVASLPMAQSRQDRPCAHPVPPKNWAPIGATTRISAQVRSVLRKSKSPD